ncbi:C4-dicarboxylate TRAP transporter substrate-binding protein [Oceanibacterium hippocampi]|uniref:Lactate-binding periplasmic protein n=1 Tax=Oceanibacterium hippocampi TaxID=745714 RepID=A0A1Y5TLW3_9PROT|nr:C4-dicarboxylate TRAP transporter substrate-binding protein [Oceanibacterium hippocampi]SLN67133.1 Lactate-binding periplasmic protein precursor [Oceanibacterium hippocampi]
MRNRTKRLVQGAAIVGTLLASGSAALAETKVVYGSFMPEPHLVHKAGLEPLFKEVEAATNGSLTFELFVGGALGGAKASLSNVRDRVTDSALIMNVYVKSDLPASSSLTELAVLGTDAMAIAGASNEMQLLACEQCEKELARNKVKALAYYSTATYNLMCTKPVSTLEDIKGLKIRAAGAFGALASELGGTPVSISAGEMYEALQRGQADCTLGAAAHLKSYNLQDVIKSVVDLPLGTFHGVLAFPINAGTWRDMTKDEQRALIKAMPGLVSRLVVGYEDESAEALANAKSNNVSVLKPGPDLVAKVAAHRKGEYDRVLAYAKDAGVEDAEQMVDRFIKLVDKWEKLVIGFDREPAKFEEALWEHVYSKLDVMN